MFRGKTRSLRQQGKKCCEFKSLRTPNWGPRSKVWTAVVGYTENRGKSQTTPGDHMTQTEKLICSLPLVPLKPFFLGFLSLRELIIAHYVFCIQLDLNVASL